MNRKGPWEGLCPSRLPLRAHFQRDVWVRGSQYTIILSWNIEWRLTDFSRNQPPINYKRLIDLKITLGKFTYPNSLRTAEVLFPAVPFLPPKNNVLFFRGREATTGNRSAVCRLLSQGLHWAFLSLYHLFSRMARLNEYLYAGLSFSFLSLPPSYFKISHLLTLKEDLIIKLRESTHSIADTVGTLSYFPYSRVRTRNGGSLF